METCYHPKDFGTFAEMGTDAPRRIELRRGDCLVP